MLNRGFHWMAPLLALIVAGCGLFSLRDPVAPIGGQTVPRCQPIDPDSTLCNVENGIRYKTLGLSLYKESLGLDFVLQLDDQDIVDLGTGRTSLDRDESEDALRIRSAAIPDSFAFAFELVPPRDLPGGVTLYEDMRYTLQFVRQEGDSIVVDEDMTIRGETDLRVIEDNSGNWVVQTWIDGRLPNPAPNEQTYGFWQASVVSSAPRPREDLVD